jgi:hypothetical protein
MDDVSDQRAARPRVIRAGGVVAGVALLVQAAVLGTVVARMPIRLSLPVTVDLGGGLTRASSRIVLTHVDVGAAVVVLCALVAVALLLSAIEPGRRWTHSGRRDARSVEFALTSSITVFLVAQLNGITDVGALVLIYAATSAMTLFSVIQDRAGAGHGTLALCFGAAIGIVPWGVIAFHQIGAGVIGDAPPPIVRVITLVMLGFTIVFAVARWREVGWRESGRERRGELIHIVLSTAATSAFAWLVVTGLA